MAVTVLCIVTRIRFEGRTLTNATLDCYIGQLAIHQQLDWLVSGDKSETLIHSMITIVMVPEFLLVYINNTRCVWPHP